MKGSIDRSISYVKERYTNTTRNDYWSPSSSSSSSQKLKPRRSSSSESVWPDSSAEKFEKFGVNRVGYCDRLGRMNLSTFLDCVKDLSGK